MFPLTYQRLALERHIWRALFSGAGGFCEGVRLAGFKVVCAVEQDIYAAKTDGANFSAVRSRRRVNSMAPSGSSHDRSTSFGQPSDTTSKRPYPWRGPLGAERKMSPARSRPARYAPMRPARSWSQTPTNNDLTDIWSSGTNPSPPALNRDANGRTTAGNFAQDLHPVRAPAKLLPNPLPPQPISPRKGSNHD